MMCLWQWVRLIHLNYSGVWLKRNNPILFADACQKYIEISGCGNVEIEPGRIYLFHQLQLRDRIAFGSGADFKRAASRLDGTYPRNL